MNDLDAFRGAINAALLSLPIWALVLWCLT